MISTVFVVSSQYDRLYRLTPKYLNSHKDRKVVIQGNTDDRGGREYNLALGQKRAEAVRKSMNLMGVSDSQIEAVSFGKESRKQREITKLPGLKPSCRHCLSIIMKKSSRLFIALLVAATWLPISQAHAGFFEDDEARRSILDLRAKVKDLENSKLDKSSGVNLTNQDDALRDEIARLRGQIEVLTNQVKTMERTPERFLSGS